MFDATELDRSVLAIGGDGRDMYFVGGGLGVAGAGSLSLHFDGERLRELPLSRSETLWWVWASPSGDDVWMVGDRGLVVRWDGERFTRIDSGTRATLFGVNGTSSDDVWIVGGTPGAGTSAENDVFLHWNGQTLSLEPVPTPRGAAMFKIWAASEFDVWAVGERGVVWRWGPRGWEDFTDRVGASGPLITVHGCSADEVYAVGGRELFAFDGNEWRRVEEVPVATALNGVYCGRDTVMVVGSGGMKARFDKVTNAWIDDQLAEPWQTDFHGAYVGSDGALWAVGGNFLDPPTTVERREGVIGRYGACAPRPVWVREPPSDGGSGSRSVDDFDPESTCASDGDCKTLTSTCHPLPFAEGAQCLPPCESDAECPADTYCVASGASAPGLVGRCAISHCGIRVQTQFEVTYVNGRTGAACALGAELGDPGAAGRPGRCEAILEDELGRCLEAGSGE